ncbi:MAG: hypothetical protein J0H01_18845 [Rhizobiales bacterium]|nr:hypothetical protein [Hyphomicrobiales bacterium]
MLLMRRRAAITAAFGLLLAALSTGSALAQRDPPAPPALQAEFRQFLVGFRQAVRANDANAVAALTRLPMQHNGDMHDQAAFHRTVYRQLFNVRNRTCLETARPSYNKDGYGNESFFLFCGQTIFVFSKKDDGFRFAETAVND